MKKCSKCKEDKELDQFNKHSSSKSKLVSWCKECVKNISKKNYEEHKEKHKINTKLSKERKKEWYILYKESLKCSKCSFNHPAIIDFHHIDPSKKDFGISSMFKKGKNENEIREEIEKCIPLCSNCHRIFHYLEKKENINIEEYLN